MSPQSSCAFCGEHVEQDSQGSWVDQTGGDCCSGDDGGCNENEPHQAASPLVVGIDRDTNTVTVALALHWNPVWDISKCEVIPVLGLIRQAITGALADTDTVTGFSYSCWDPDEERDLGYLPDYSAPVCAGCGKRVRWTDEKWRAPEGWEHVDVIDPNEPCDRLSGRSDAGYVVEFPNVLDVTFARDTGLEPS